MDSELAFVVSGGNRLQEFDPGRMLKDRFPETLDKGF